LLRGAGGADLGGPDLAVAGQCAARGGRRRLATVLGTESDAGAGVILAWLPGLECLYPAYAPHPDRPNGGVGNPVCPPVRLYLPATTAQPAGDAGHCVAFGRLDGGGQIPPVVSGMYGREDGEFDSTL